MPNFCIGIDLAQHVDFSALAVVERLVHATYVPFGGDDENYVYEDVYRIAHLRQWPRGTAPQTVVADLADLILVARPLLDDAYIAYDATGIGKSWADLFNRRHRAGELTRWAPRGYTITGEQTPSHGLSVKKIDLMSLVQTTADDGRLEQDEDMHLADRFKVQLLAITAKPTSTGRLSFGAPQAVHDDLVTAVSLAMHARSGAEPRMYGTEPAPALNPLAPLAG